MATPLRRRAASNPPCAARWREASTKVAFAGPSTNSGAYRDEEVSMPAQRVFILAIAAAAAFLGFSAPASAAEIHVPGDAPSIQEAINRAGPGDIIFIAPQVYGE